jgi:hypothetical protein
MTMTRRGRRSCRQPLSSQADETAGCWNKACLVHVGMRPAGLFVDDGTAQDQKRRASESVDTAAGIQWW